METFLFPINLKSTITRDVIIDDNRLRLRRITEEEILRFFKIRVKKRAEDGIIESLEATKDFNILSDPLNAFLIGDKMFVMSSQFILEAKDITCVNWFQQALKLSKNGRSGVYYGVNQKTDAIHFLHPIPFYGKNVYSLEEDDIAKIQDLYKTIKATKSKRYDLIVQKFLFALSGLSLRSDHRFLELATILEMLYSSKSARTELKFRLSLRACKVLSKYQSLAEEQTFKDMKKIYDIRSGISHSGSHKETDKYLEKLIDYTRKSIVLFLNDPSIFEDEKLDELCIRNWSLDREKLA